MCEILAFTGGKESPGKTCLALNTAVTLGKMGAKVLLLDMNVSVANVGTALGLQPLHTLNDLVWGYCSPEEVIVPWGHNVSLMALGEPVGWSGKDKMSQLLSMARLLDQHHFILIDTPAGETASLGPFLAGVPHVLAVVTPEDVASAEATAFITALHRIALGKHIFMILNKVPVPEIAEAMSNRLEHDLGKILGVPSTCLGYVPDESLMFSALQQRLPLVVMAPESETTFCFTHLARTVVEIWGAQPHEAGSESFLRDLFVSLQNDKALSSILQGETKPGEGFQEAASEEVELFRQIIFDALDPNKANSLDFATMYQHVREVVQTFRKDSPMVERVPSPSA
ncbi:MAG: P-loop NTPase [Desulfomonilaceae bacterium]